MEPGPDNDQSDQTAGPSAAPAAATAMVAATPTVPSAQDLRRNIRWTDVVGTLLRILATTTVLLVIYYWVPMNPRDPKQPLFEIALWFVVLVGVVAAQVFGILRAARPAMRAIEALVFIIVLFLLSFAACYYEFGLNNPASFTQTLSRTDAVYFTVTVFATVGFGDIAPVTQAARITCTIQMLLDLALIGAGVRLIVAAARIGQARKQAATVAGGQATAAAPDSA